MQKLTRIRDQLADVWNRRYLRVSLRRQLRSIALSCSVFEIIWLRAGPMALASGIRKMSAWVSGIAGLSIIDLSERAAQPMASADGKLVITFNGEIYNYRQLRASLEKKGLRLSHAD